MQYKVNILGKSYDLPARTISVEEQIAAVGALDNEYKSGRLTIRETVEKMHAFVESFAPGAFPNLEETDINELNAAAISIIEAYNAPARKIKNDAQMVGVREIVNRPEVKKVLEAVPALSTIDKK